MTVELDNQVDQDTAPPARRRLPGDSRAAANREPVPFTPFAPPPPAPQADPEPVTEADLTPADYTPEPDDFTNWAIANDPGPTGPVIEQVAVKEAPATWGRKQRLIRLMSVGLIHPKPGAEERAYRANRSLIRTTGWSRSVRVMVANRKGGVGKTPTAIILAGMMAEVGRHVIVWDASDARGDLSDRGESAPLACVSEVANDPGAFRLPGTIGGIVGKQDSFADVLGSLTDRVFDGEDIDRVTWALDRTHQIQVADTGANATHSTAFDRVLDLADIVVVPTTVTTTSVKGALALLERVERTDASAVVVVNRYGGPETPGLYGQLERIFTDAGVGAHVEVPFDPEIAKGTGISTAALSRPSRLAWTRLAATVVANIHPTTEGPTA